MSDYKSFIDELTYVRPLGPWSPVSNDHSMRPRRLYGPV